ncbi:nucleotide sugar dehydrogenase [Vagococcus lutrae]|uniref:Nucleotide sugar dehydrogenase n=1 Tax=Vagococcus lutrae TaxID=81947 RepID=A0AAF0BG72_9ENTE|nr:nucleotide sugar dehydrogenase [Vagococcus lutrae]WCG22714.1 nucleotide sugar dehydrogenase [Vagococcus lutrae]
MINVIGLGYIGLPTSLMLASHKNKVVGTDINTNLVNKLNKGEITFEEEGLQDLFSKALKENITFSTEYIKTDFYIVTVPTPYIKKSKKIDSQFVQEAVKQIIEVCEPETILIIESTVSPGTIDKSIRPLLKESLKKIHLVHAPERILPGNMINELRFNPRTLGVDDKETGEKVKQVYKSFCEADIVLTDIRTAEMSKVIENTYRDVNIAFANELANIARFDNLDVYEIIKIANMHPRVNILNPGPGVGGHCISVDPWFLVGDYPEQTKLIATARSINDSRPLEVLKRINSIMKENNITDNDRVGVYGLTYKQDVDDIRESPTLQMFNYMEESLSTPLKVYDPMIKEKILSSQYLNFDTFIQDIDLLVVMVAHTHLKTSISQISGKIVLDTQNLIEDAYKL